jgi:hypothetical protein
MWGSGAAPVKPINGSRAVSPWQAHLRQRAIAALIGRG